MSKILINFITVKVVFLSKDDMSYNKVATQSRTYPGMGYDASNAVDRNTATCMRTDAIGINSPDKKVWWKVDLGGVHTIYRINIVFKTYNGVDGNGKGMFCKVGKVSY